MILILVKGKTAQNLDIFTYTCSEILHSTSLAQKIFIKGIYTFKDKRCDTTLGQRPKLCKVALVVYFNIKMTWIKFSSENDKNAFDKISKLFLF